MLRSWPAVEPLKTVFLSASVPDPNFGAKYHLSGDVRAIFDFIGALIVTILPHGRLAFAGHPVLTPLVVHFAEQVEGGRDRVRVYQSEYFPHPEAQLAGPTHVDIYRTPEVSGDRGASLARMRELMITDEDPYCGVFVGGMEGVEEEFRSFRRIWPDRPVLPIASTGGAAKILLDMYEADVVAVAPPAVAGTVVARLRGDLGYNLLIRDVVRPLL